jgi:hypothetical protein
MKSRWIVTALLFVSLLCFSCKSGPGVQPSVQSEENEQPLPAVSEASAEEVEGGDDGAAGGGEDLPEVSPSPAEPSSAPLTALPEPAADLPQTGLAEPPPPEEPVETSLPEPPAGPPEEPVPAAPPAEVPAPVETAAPAEAPAPAVVPVPVPPPSLPPHLRPAEEEVPPAVVREPVPLPVNPLPEAPALPPQAEEEVVYSRAVRAITGQLVEIPFRGTGWVYLGELGSRRGIAYHSRRLDPEGQSFVFRAEAAGTYGLKFYKQDFIRDYILNDYVQVIVGDPPETAGAGWFNPPIDRGRVVAEPRWPDTGEEAEARRRQNTAPIASSTGQRDTAAPPTGPGEAASAAGGGWCRLPDRGTPSPPPRPGSLRNRRPRDRGLRIRGCRLPGRLLCRGS